MDPISGVGFLHHEVETVDLDDVFSITNLHHDTNSEEPHSDLHDRQPGDGNFVRPHIGPLRSAVVKRAYKFHNRTKSGPLEMSALRKKRLKASRTNENPFLSPRFCCKRNNCFQEVDKVFAFAQFKRMMKMNREELKRTVTSLYNPETRTMRFNGKSVCSNFLAKAFGVSKTLQCSIKGTLRARASPSIKALPRCRKLNNSMKNSIIIFLESLSANVAQSMPDKNEQILPAFQKNSVYDLYVQTFDELDEHGNRRRPATKSYFLRVWSRYVPTVKVRKTQRFTKCSECEFLRDQLQACGLNESRALPLRQRQKEHYNVIEAERREYRKKSEQSEREPNLYCSLIIDGADQSAFGLPHFTVSTKGDKGEKIKVKLIGALEHGKARKLSLFLMTDEFETGGNHIIETIHRVLQEKHSSQPLPPVLYMQLDNCWRENKNRYVLGYLESLVRLGVFKEVHVSFLPIGHTHSDIDQCFSRTSQRLKHHDAVTMDDLVTELRAAYRPQPVVSRILHVANYSGLCEKERCLRKVPPFSHFRYFKFLRNSSTPVSPRESFNTTCLVRVGCNDDWEELPNKSGKNKPGKGFLLNCPNMEDTPPTTLFSPDNIGKVNKCLDASEERIGNPLKLHSLRCLRDEVYEDRVVPFQWNLQNSFEQNGLYRQVGPSAPELDEEEITENLDLELTDSCEPRSKYDYFPGEMVATRTNLATCLFWLAEVIEVSRTDQSGIASFLKVRWLESEMNNSDIFSSKYRLSFIIQKGRKVPFIQVISVDTILVRFSSLKRDRKIAANDAKAIRNALNVS